MTRPPLPLYEEIMLLALDDDKGTSSAAGFHCKAMGGAILAELAMAGAISIEDDKKKRVTVKSRRRLGDPLLDECLVLVVEAKKPKKASEWVMKFSGLKDLKKRVSRQLVVKGILTEETDTVLRVFKRTVFPEADGGPEQELRDRMKKAIFTSTTNLEARTVVIIALAHSAQMLNRVFDKKKLKERKKRVEQLANGQLAGKATKEAVEAVQAAVMVTTIMPAVFVATN